MTAIVADFRGVIVLLADEPAADDPATTVAWLLFECRARNGWRRWACASRATPRPRRRFWTGWSRRPAYCTMPTSSPSATCSRTCRSRRAAKRIAACCDAIQARYDAEMKKLFGRLPTRGLVDRREAWEDYLAFVRGARSRRDALIARTPPRWRPSAAGARGGGGPGATTRIRSPGPLPRQVGAADVRRRAVVAIHAGDPRYPAALRCAGVFFQVGRNVGKAEAETRRILAAGHALANHSFSHAFLPKLDADELNHQLVDTNQALSAAVNEKPSLFRPPYGARNERSSRRRPRWG